MSYVIDLHCDTISAIKEARKNNNQIELKENLLHIDIKKLKKGNYLAQNFAMFVDLEECENPFEEAMLLIDLFFEEIEKNKSDIAVAYTYDDIVKNKNAGKISAILTAEEGDICKGNIAFLHLLYRLGVRMMTLTWNYSNHLNNMERGLTPVGIEFVREMERLNVIIDVSHLSDAGFYDICKYAQKPFVASHSNARALCSHHRNLPDDAIREIGERGGLVGINYYGTFLDEVNQNSTIENIIAHMNYIRNIAGIETLALGSDFDGMSCNLELKNASYMDRLYEGMRTNQFTESEIDKVFYKNALNFYKRELVCYD